jgi:hypothetical protein
VHQAAPVLITEHSAGQDPNRRPIASPANYRMAATSSDFDWGDAGVGAGATVELMVALSAASPSEGVARSHKLTRRTNGAGDRARPVICFR